VSDAVSPPVLARARLRRDRGAAALARVLVPEDPGNRLGAAHSLVWALFADEPGRRRDFLWREMRPGEFLILAARMPADPHGLFDLECKPFAPALRAGQRLRFDLRANPVTSVRERPGQRGKRADVVMHALFNIVRGERAIAREAAVRDGGLSWLARKGELAGFAVDAERLTIDGYDKVRIPRDGGRAVVFLTLNFQGELTVWDPLSFVVNVVRGFGAAKAFGCGLMLIRRAAP
jgi:CRISPR system Cascade subunit CasE